MHDSTFAQVTATLWHRCTLLTGLFTGSQLHLSINKKHWGSCDCFYYIFITTLSAFSSPLTLSAFLFYASSLHGFTNFEAKEQASLSSSSPSIVSLPTSPEKGSPWEFSKFSQNGSDEAIELGGTPRVGR